MKSFLIAIGDILVLVAFVLFLTYAPSFQASEADQQPFSFAENIGQMLIVGFEGTDVTPELNSFLERIKPGGILLLGRNIVDKKQTKKLIAKLQEISLQYTGIPLFVAVDQEGGLVSRFWWAESTPQSRLRSFEHAFTVGAQRARDLKEVGVNMNLAPVLDSTNFADYVFPRSFQTDADTAFLLSKGLVQGFLSEGIIPVPKHFPGYDGVALNPEITDIPNVSHVPATSVFPRLFQTERLPFVMVSHVLYEDIDKEHVFPFSKAGIAFLKAQLGEHVLVVSDDILSPAFVNSVDVSQISMRAFEAGVDILLVAQYPSTEYFETFYQGFLRALQDNAPLHSSVEESVSRILKMKKALLQTFVPL